MNLAEPEIDAEGRGDNFEEVVSSSSLSTAGGFQIGLRSSVFGLFFEHNLSVRVYDNLLSTLYKQCECTGSPRVVLIDAMLSEFNAHSYLCLLYHPSVPHRVCLL